MRVILFFLLLAQSTLAFALDPLLSLRVGEAETKLNVIEQFLQKKDVDKRLNADLLQEFLQQGNFVKKVSNECIELNETAINKSADDLDLLGPQTLSEDPEVTSKRQSLNQSMLSNAQQLASCRLLLLRTIETVDRLSKKQQLALIQPEVIVTLGRFAAQELLKTTKPIGKLRGQWHIYEGIPLMPTFHPAYLLRNPSGKRPVWEDMKQVMQRLSLT